MALLGVTLSRFFFPLVGCVVLVLLIITAVLQPYKANIHNRINIFFLSVIIFSVISYLAVCLALSETVQYKHFAYFMFGLAFSIPMIYIVGVTVCKVFAHRMWVKNLYEKMCRMCKNPKDEDFERILPERMINVEECAALLADPMEVNTYT